MKNEFDDIKRICFECTKLRELLINKIPEECYLGETKDGDLILKTPGNRFGVCYTISLHNSKIDELRGMISELPKEIQSLMPVPRKIILKK